MAIQDFVTGQVLTSTQMDNLQANDYNQTVSAKVASYVLVAADKGTRITMSNAGATTITVNTSLFAAGDTLYISNIGAGVSTITAGTATVTTAGSLALAQWASGTLYFTSPSAAIYIAGGVTAASGMTLITSAAFSSVTSFSVNNCFSATYKNYLIFINPTSTSATNTLKLRVSGTDSSTGWYTGSIAQPCNGGAVASSGGANSASWPLGLFQSGYAQNISLQNPNVASPTSVSTVHTDTNGAAGNFNMGGGWHDPATAYDGFTITLASSGSGSYYVYGYGL